MLSMRHVDSRQISSGSRNPSCNKHSEQLSYTLSTYRPADRKWLTDFSHPVAAQRGQPGLGIRYQCRAAGPGRRTSYLRGDDSVFVKISKQKSLKKIVFRTNEDYKGQKELGKIYKYIRWRRRGKREWRNWTYLKWRRLAEDNDAVGSYLEV